MPAPIPTYPCLLLDEYRGRPPVCFKGQGFHMPLCSHADSLPLHGLFQISSFSLWESPLVTFYQLSFESHSINRPVFFLQMLFSQVVHFYRSFKPLSGDPVQSPSKQAVPCPSCTFVMVLKTDWHSSILCLLTTYLLCSNYSHRQAPDEE